MSWFSKLLPSRIRIDGLPKRSVPEGIWASCSECKGVLYRAELTRNLEVCVKCGHHMRISARERLSSFLDPESATEICADIAPVDFLKFRDSRRYRDRLGESQKGTGEQDALVAMTGTLMDQPIAVCAFEFNFMGGSMGSVVGEKLARAATHAFEERCPLVVFSASGGARMQEGLTSLMQMGKTSAAIGRLKEAGVPYVSVLTDPTMGGVSASFAMLGDVIIAEPGALIGFAGPRVIEQTVRQVLPDGFQRAEFLLEHGAIDMIVERRRMREEIAHLLAILTRRTRPVARPVVPEIPRVETGDTATAETATAADGD